ncbi:MAG: hypothetical protein AB8G17_20565 [Gammaproteobacteria bacterium]
MASAFSLLMIVHRRVDAATAVITSISAVLRNLLIMMLWLTVAIAGLLIGLLDAGIGLIVTLPVIGRAAWRGYLKTIDTDAFLRHEAGVTAVANTLANGTGSELMAPMTQAGATRVLPPRNTSAGCCFGVVAAF